MAKKDRFPGIKPKNTKEELKKMDEKLHTKFKDELPKTAFMFLDNFVFIGVHLSSKKK